MTEKKSFEMDMVRGPVLKKMLRFSLPLMFSSILQILFNAADIIVVGPSGEPFYRSFHRR